MVYMGKSSVPDQSVMLTMMLTHMHSSSEFVFFFCFCLIFLGLFDLGQFFSSLCD